MSRNKFKGKKRQLAKASSSSKKLKVRVGPVVKKHPGARARGWSKATDDIGSGSGSIIVTDGTTNLTTDQRRKKVKFVYPRVTARSGQSQPEPVEFYFRKRSKVDGRHPNLNLSHDNIQGTKIEEHERMRPSVGEASETIESILVGKNGKLPNTQSKISSQVGSESAFELESISTQDENTQKVKANMSRKLSGVSVQDAIKDKTGCRPRANSTDGELNLPRRGLCDEGMVLGSHQWPTSWPQRAPKGLTNLGNTCFLNATLQCLAYIPPLCQCLTSLETRTGKLGQGQRITELLKRLFRQVHDLDGGKSNGFSGGAISPRQIVKAIPTLGSIGSRNGYKFRPGRQEDAHEFLVHLLDAMQDGELKAAGINQHSRGWRDKLPIPRLDETTFVHRVFGGYLRSQVRCTKCGYCSNTYDPFLDLALEVSKKSSNSISSAFQEFARKETLDRDNRWRCSGCRKDVCATKQLTVFRPPLSLCMQLKRFTFSNGMGFGSFGGYPKGLRPTGMGGGSKINKNMEFPSRLKLPLSDGRKCEYALTGVVVHLGGSATSGHYTAFVKKPGGEGSSKWYHMDDSFVEPVSESAVLKQKDAYVLFYCRTEVKLELPSPPPRASMTTEEAKELNAVRSKTRARSSSLSRDPPPHAVEATPIVVRTMEAIDKKVVASDRFAKDIVRNKEELEKNKSDLESASYAPSKDKTGIHENCDACLAKKTPEDDASPINTALQPPAQSNRKSELSEPRAGQTKKTRVVLDRGTSHGKLEVIIGRRFKVKKAWKPKTTVAHLSTDNLDLLGTRSVSKWEVEDVLQAQKDDRKEAVQEMEKKERVRKRSMHLDRWDSSLDQGMKKKVKAPVEEAPRLYHDSKTNPFHRIQSGMQKMNRGQAKGLHYQGKKGSIPRQKGKRVGKNQPNYKSR